MKAVAAVVIGILASYLTLVWAVGHLGAVSSTVCSPEFTLPAIACRAGGLGITVLLVPLSGIVTFLLARSIFAKS